MSSPLRNLLSILNFKCCPYNLLDARTIYSFVFVRKKTFNQNGGYVKFVCSLGTDLSSKISVFIR